MQVVESAVGAPVNAEVFAMVLLPVGVGVGVGVGVVGGVVGGVGGVGVWLEHSGVVMARSVLVLARRESAWRTVASKTFWAAVIGAAEPVPECDDEPVELAVPVVPPVLVLPVLLLAVPAVVPPVPVLAAVPVTLLVPVVPPVLVLLVLLPVVPAAPPVPVAAETWPDCAWTRVRLALATWPWAVAMAYFREVVSKVARTWPAVTLSPMVTGTVATIPDTAKDTVAALEGCVVPVACSVCVTG